MAYNIMSFKSHPRNCRQDEHPLMVEASFSYLEDADDIVERNILSSRQETNDYPAAADEQALTSNLNTENAIQHYDNLQYFQNHSCYNDIGLPVENEKLPQLDSSSFDFNHFGGPNFYRISRRDYSLPVELDYEVLESQCVLQHKKSCSQHSSFRKSNSSRAGNILSRLRRGSGSLNDVSQSEISKSKSNAFEFGTDLDLSEQSEKVKTKLMSVWNNMKYGWTIKTKTSFKCESQVYLLGKCYHIKKEEEDTEYAITRNPVLLTAMEKFRRDFTSRLWFTYRRDIPPLPLSNLTTDCGWGCMLRCGQMIIAQGLVSHFLGREWRLYHHQSDEDNSRHLQIIRWFGDYSEPACPFSLHSLILRGQFTNKKTGDWYGPASVSRILQYALVLGRDNHQLLKSVGIYVAQDCTVYLGDIVALATEEDTVSGSFTDPPVSTRSEWKRGMIILIPMRLGGEVTNPVYIPCVKAALAQENCIGIIGGKPRHSMFFVGWQEDKLIYLDPHYCQDVVDVKQTDFRIESYHCMSPRKIAISKLDPSCTLGFYCQSQVELDRLVCHTKEMTTDPKISSMYPLFVISRGRSSRAHGDASSGRSRYRPRSCSPDSDEFVVL